MVPSIFPELSRAIGIVAVHTNDPATVELRLSGSAPGVVDVAMLTDYALGAALRGRVGLSRPLPTITLTVELDAERLAPGISTRAWSEPPSCGLGRASGIVLLGGEKIGHCIATFAVPQSRDDVPALPWEKTDDVPVVGVGVSAEALLANLVSMDGDAVVLSPDDSVLNRSGTVQGGVLFRIAASPPDPDAHLMSGHLQFLTAADRHSPVSAHQSVHGRTRRTTFTGVVVRQEGRIVAVGTFTFRRGR